jgi:general secretion pathway protein A
MYLDFYGLRERPFNATPDPRFLHLTPGHREALAQLLYGVGENRGFIVLTGEVGTGKTTLLHTLLQRLEGRVAVSFIPNCTLPFDGLLEYMLEDFGIAKPGRSQAERLFALNLFLIERWRAGQGTLLILDEAQNLTVETLEQVRLLSNFETPTAKLLQILLVGQPELRARLQLPALRQLRQRISLRCAIRPLTETETREYILARLRVADAPDPGLFTDRAVQRIARYARGIPRVVNMVCDHALLFGYTAQRRIIDRDLVAEAITYLEEGERVERSLAPARRFSPTLRWVVGGLGAMAAGVAGLVAVDPWWEPLLTGVLAPLLDVARGARELVLR